MLNENFFEKIETDVLEYLVNWREEINGYNEYPPMASALCPWFGWNTVCSEC